MDTSTHIIMGFGLAGLAYIDPAVGQDPELAAAIMAGTVLGSNAPDFDYAVRVFKGKGMYTEHHRGLSHSVPAWFIWSFLLTAIILIFSPSLSGQDWMHLAGWTFAAVLVHVLFDVFNAYGTQAARPFTKKWLSLNFIPLFDPLIVFLHIAGFALWAAGESPGLAFSVIYTIIFVYVIERFFSSRRALARIRSELRESSVLTVVPTIRWSVWQFVSETETGFTSGELRSGQVRPVHSFEKTKHELISAAEKDQNTQHFLKNSKHVHRIVIPNPSGYEVRFFDLRFRTKNHYPYMAVCLLARNGEILSSQTGWIHQTGKLHKTLLPQNSSGTAGLDA
ncbi:metal-dependent hydrolase [Metabacillus sp. JX24]|uniref:metal-dependent hydrolase n=1 Tax=Metabacillus sp. JX24 TaxID=3240759 RepID=UPI0035105BF9